MSRKLSREYRHPISSESKQDTQTPDWLYHWLGTWIDRTYGECFELDAAASPKNAKHPTYYTRADNGLLKPWRRWTFCNPPFRRIGLWVSKARWEASHDHPSILVLPDNTASEWYRRAYRYAQTWLLNPRFAYKGRGGSVPFGTMVMIFTPDYHANPATDRIWLFDVAPAIAAYKKGIDFPRIYP